LFNEEPDQRVVQWLRQVHPTTTWTTSVCTGSLYLPAAGILDGQDATTRWAWAEELERRGARYTEQQVAEHGKVITAAGVPAGIDMALTLLARMHGPQIAEGVQVAIEYDPHPPFDTGSPSKAPAELADFVRWQLNTLAAPNRQAQADVTPPSAGQVSSSNRTPSPTATRGRQVRGGGGHRRDGIPVTLRHVDPRHTAAGNQIGSGRASSARS
jgi:hypothetical protein